MWGPRRQKSTVAFPLFPGSVLVVLKLFSVSLSYEFQNSNFQNHKTKLPQFHVLYPSLHYILKQHKTSLCYATSYHTMPLQCLSFSIFYLASLQNWTLIFHKPSRVIHSLISFHLFVLSSFQLQGFFLFCATRWRKKTHQRTGPKLQNFQTKTKPQSLKTPKEPTSTTTTKQGCGVLTLWKAFPLTKKPNHLPAKN